MIFEFMKIRLSLKHIRNLFLTLACLWVAGGIGYWFGQHDLRSLVIKDSRIEISRNQPVNKAFYDLSLFWTVWDRLFVSYLRKADLQPGKMIYGAISGMVASLGDPYTAFLPPEENKQVKEDLNGAFGGVGIQLGYLNDRMAVIAPLSGTPAEKAGVKAGDFIIKIGDKDVADISLPEAVTLIRGPEGSKIKLVLLHEGAKDSYEVSLVRETILVPSVDVSFLEKENIAHLKLLRFGERTNDEWEKAIDKIVSRQPAVAGIVLDLRNNPGGLLTGSVFIASEFLPSGVVVEQENSGGAKNTYSVNRPGKITIQPLVVLVNKGSASASEIVAGTLKYYNRAKIVGETTFGKGTIQEAQDLPGEAGLHITSARWLLPNDQSIDKVGVRPDIEVTDDLKTVGVDEQLQVAVKAVLEVKKTANSKI